ncbi:MAG: TRAP transporter small permease [Tannerellaceae bacterium]
MKEAHAFITELSEKIGNISSLLILPMIILIIYSTIKRYFFKDMPSWGYEIPIFIYGIHFLLGGIVCQAKNKHVNVDILPKYISKKAQRRLVAFANFLIASICIILAYYSVFWAYDSFLINEKSVHQTNFNPSVWWFKCFVPFSFFAIAIQSIANIRKVCTLNNTTEGDL